MSFFPDTPTILVSFFVPDLFFPSRTFYISWGLDIFLLAFSCFFEIWLLMVALSISFNNRTGNGCLEYRGAETLLLLSCWKNDSRGMSIQAQVGGSCDPWTT